MAGVPDPDKEGVWVTVGVSKLEDVTEAVCVCVLEAVRLAVVVCDCVLVIVFVGVIVLEGVWV